MADKLRGCHPGSAEDPAQSAGLTITTSKSSFVGDAKTRFQGPELAAPGGLGREGSRATRDKIRVRLTVSLILVVVLVYRYQYQ